AAGKTVNGDASPEEPETAAVEKTDNGDASPQEPETDEAGANETESEDALTVENSEKKDD
ncbi:MAG: hypothetical protein N2F24_14010, partial [Deltaproteobacteria bacterium]